MALLQHNERLDDGAAFFIGPADDATFSDRFMREQRRLDLGAGDVVAGGDDHVVGARLVEEVARLVHEVGIAGDVPAVLHVILLALICQVAAAGRSLHRELADDAGLAWPPFLIEHRRAIAGDGIAGGAAAHALGRMRDEDVHHLGRADAVDDLDAGRPLEQLARRIGQRLAGRDAFLQRRQIEPPSDGRHLPVHDRRGEAGVGLEALDGLEQRLRRVLLDQHR